MDLKPGSFDVIKKDEAAVINRCIAYGKKYTQFCFIPSADEYSSFTRHDQRRRNKHSVKVEILKVRDEAQLRQWRKVLEHIVSGTCYEFGKQYVNRYRIVTYYLNVKWREFAIDWVERDNYVVPPPTERT
jgi:hypothetical protein